jgi:hypothetical protein
MGPRARQCGLWCRPLGFSVADAWKVASTIHMGIMQSRYEGSFSSPHATERDYEARHGPGAPGREDSRNPCQIRSADGFQRGAKGSGAGRSSPGSVLRSDPKGRCPARIGCGTGKFMRTVLPQGERLCDDPPARPSIVTGSSKDRSSSEGSYVTITDDELKDLQIESSKIIWHSGANGTNVNRGRLTLWIPSRSARGLRAPIGAMFRAW